ncbi:heavy metal-associated isoprenylated plant protein 34-like [Abrus precatorius]|uniref:Heavy metal-associated isoprenylated plant protein 34-like n=1 Tax=Abrus precatorius TaxID=3816 RepID=A0A8B8L1Z1_ABRPR|nr:heavy metal-associated isoprenylated plant protein 34-like [Abrus precatorius]
MSKQDLLRIQSCILKVNIHCDGCEQKVKKLLHKIDGVYSVSVDADKGKVVVVGDVDPAKLVKKLKRAGKHAEIWGGQKGIMNNQNYPFNHQFLDLQVGDGTGEKDNKSQGKKGKKNSGGGGQGQLAHLQNIKGAQDFKVPAKEHKSVQFSLPEVEFDAIDDGFDEYDVNFDEHEEERYGHAMPMHNKMMPMMGDGRGPAGPTGMIINGPARNKHMDNGGGGRNNGSAKKGDVIDQAMLIKGKGGNYIEAEIGNKGGRKCSGDQKGINNKGNKPKPKNAKSDGGLLGWFLGFGKKGKKGEESSEKNKININSKGKEGKKIGGKLEDHSNNIMSKIDVGFHDLDDSPPPLKNGKTGNKGSNTNVGPMGNNQIGNIPAVQGLPATNGGGGYYQGMQMQPSPYNLQQQQYMGMTMNPQQQHQQANMNGMYPTVSPIMYGRPHPSMNYMPPPPMPSHPMADPITHTFSDENVESCIIM